MDSFPWNQYDESELMRSYWQWRIEEWEKLNAAGKAKGPRPEIPKEYPTYQVRHRRYNEANVDAWNKRMVRWISQDFPRRSSTYDPGPPPAKPICATFFTKKPNSIIPDTRSPFKKFLDGYIIFSGFTFLAICFCVFAFLMWWLIGILSGSYFMAWLTVILMAAAIPITIHYGMKK